ncbi:hypothetical protein [Saccharopolyspora rectivirgula]|jgi:xanthine/uracil/vitamin C permease (AzgA family)|uniref:Uncharacterized protein n=1 Tax=Saccharopolyspora rectivirgula TaxID=28042 RepID=A0A073B631_9PSEU|nr:hypothetical protein [Saccharopolyspora rectivirgula]KEI43089.1 hypothetical protein GU90_18355 [Saccharopolyspora rectivirgula]MCC5697322.1 hypothetical protein [Klebsiella pneumoniae]
MTENRRARTAGAFDVRTVIGMLFLVYGVVLLATGLVQSAEAIEKAAGVNINLWSGIGMVVVSALFFLWARLRPIIVPESPQSSDQ